MELTIKQSNLLKAVKTVSGLSTSRSTLAILSNLLLSADGNEIKLTATNLEAAAIYKIPGKVSREGSVTIPSKLLLDLVGSVAEDTITISSTGDKTDIVTNKLHSTINSLPAEDFPTIPKSDDDNYFTFPSQKLRNGLVKVMSASSKDDTRPVLNGVHIFTQENTLTLVATDSYRLSEFVIEGDSPDLNMIIPNQAAQELSTILESSENVDVSYSDGQAQFSTPDAVLISKTIDGKYPDYKNLIPNNSEVNLVVNKNELISAVKTAGLFARDAGGSIQFIVKDDTLNVRSAGTQLGENNTIVEGKISGEGEVAFNSRFMTEALSNLEGDTAKIGYSSNISPIVVVDQGSSDLTQLIMPLKT